MSGLESPPIADKKFEVSHIEESTGLTPVLVDESAVKRAHAAKGQDDAAAILAENEGVEYSLDEDKKVMWKVTRWVLTPMMLIYTIQQMDKSSISYAAVFGIQKATGLHGTQYSWLTSVLYLVQLGAQPLSAYALIVISARKWITFNVLAWGIVIMCTSTAKNFVGLMICRALLGLFEATVAPTFLALTQANWRRREQTYIATAWFVSNSLASIFGPLIAYGVEIGIQNGHSKLQPYQGIFLFLGAITIVSVPILYWMLPDSLATAHFLRPRERYIAVERLRENNMGTKNSQFKWDQAKEAFRDPKSYLWFLLFVLVALPSGGFSAFGGLITKGFGFTAFQSILFQMPIGVFQILGLMLATFLVNKYHTRSPVIALLCIFPIGGALGMIFVNRKDTHGLLGCYYVAQLLGCIQPMLYGWAILNSSGTTKKNIVTAILFVGQCVGNIIGPQVYLEREKPKYLTGLAVDIACWGLLCILTIVTGAYLRYLNYKQEKRRIALGRSGRVVDLSILSVDEANKYRDALKAEAATKGYVMNAEAFDDLTDFQNPDFQYVW